MKRYLLQVMMTGVWLLGHSASAEDLLVGKVCPVTYQQQNVGILVFSKAWYHSGRQQASYIARDNATGVGIEIHLFANTDGELDLDNKAQCSQYRILQVRTTNRRLLDGEQRSQVDAPKQLLEPFYDAAPLEHGYGVHDTPEDNRDKPWQGRPKRSSTLAIYDTPFVSDALGKEGQDIQVEFETCVVCQRDVGYDSILSCGRWGYVREFLDENTGWAEPEFNGTECLNTPTESYQETVNLAEDFQYSYWLNWR
ncbi:hypothetical protein ACVFI8_15690 [Agarivorans sp. MS3-6]|uniref:hypothetical protein n=1 Tax=Agarivorans sp. TSD2052 TaxID=2937286 RepID=UPI00200FEC34|nr:hypothetical protein [Agarivorans sp. TSD2052]UPW17697.1 hypothetical protein M0C34_15820 [Agarivorans sp. TSD2052]